MHLMVRYCCVVCLQYVGVDNGDTAEEELTCVAVTYVYLPLPTLYNYTTNTLIISKY